MIFEALADVYVYLPAFAANAAPVIAKNLPILRGLNRPIYATYMGKNKTWRGFVSGLFLASLVCMGQYAFGSDAAVHVSLGVSAFLGLVLGAGALVGDMVESAVKRILRIQPGKALPYWDGVDYIIGAILFLLPWYVPSWQGVVALLFIAPLASLAANTCSYAIGWKQQWY